MQLVLTDTAGQFHHYLLLDGAQPVATLAAQQLGNALHWALPVWSAPGRVWLDVLYMQAGHADRCQSWCPAALLPAAAAAGWRALRPPQRWLQAATYVVATPQPFSMRYPTAADQIALGQYLQRAGGTTVIGQVPQLGATLDAVQAGFAGRWGAPLEACSALGEVGDRLLGVALVTSYGPAPLLALWSAAAPLVGRELALTALDALHQHRYPALNLLLAADDPLHAVALEVGFAAVEELVMVERG